MKTGLALIGTGYWGPGIARNLDALPNVQLLHLVDREPQRARDVAERLGCEAQCHDDKYQRIRARNGASRQL